MIKMVLVLATFIKKQEDEKGLIKLGDCELFGDDPQWFCKDCRKKFWSKAMRESRV